MRQISTAILGFFSTGAWAQTTPEVAGDLTITEVMAETQEVFNYYGEWFEIYNASGRNLELNGLEIAGASDDIGFFVSGSFGLAAGEYFVFGVESDTSLNGGIDVDFQYDRTTFVLDHTGDTIALVYEGDVIDTLTWDSADWPIVRDSAHQVNLNAESLEWANDFPQNWCGSDVLITSSSSNLFGTPGERNIWCDGSNDDSDGDGYTEATGDCDDLDPEINPDAIDGDDDGYFGAADDDADCDGVRDDGATDDDGDGYRETDGDCNDENADIHPGADEVADGNDTDCNGCVDDVDDDGDGYTECKIVEDLDCDGDGTPEFTELYDCDDEDGDTYPCAVEIPYDAIDQDCDGYDLCDQDDDGYEGEDCPEGSRQFPNKESDCDDLDAEINPGNGEGDPAEGGSADGKDNDCNGIVDDPWQDADGDGFTLADGDCWDDAFDVRSAEVNPGAIEICSDLLDNDCDGLLNDGCENASRYAALRGGRLCGVVGGGASPETPVAMWVFCTMLAVGMRRRSGGG